jgi:transaldolase
MIESGKLKEMIGLGLRGMTSNPTIFDKAIRLSGDYDKRIEELCNSGRSTFEIYDDLTVKDVQDASDIFRPVYDKTDGLDGYVSLEVDPRMAFKTEETVMEARRLSKKVSRPNVMLKIPATDAGFKAIEELVSEGMNINATLIFSLEQYIGTSQAYINGISRCLENGGDPGKIQSVASVFVSRIDTFIDNEIDKNRLPISLKGKAAVSNSRMIFKRYKEIFSGDRFKGLKEKGAKAQRVLWASTSTKNPAYSDIKYITELIGRGTVNTLPENTFQAFLDHGLIEEALGADVSDAGFTIQGLRKLGLDIDTVCRGLLKDGILSFEKSFEALLSSIDKKAASLCKN